MTKELGSEDQGTRFRFSLLSRGNRKRMPNFPRSLWLSGTGWFLVSAEGALALTTLRRGMMRELVSGPQGLVGKTVYTLGMGTSLLLWESKSTFPSSHLQGIGS